MPTLVIDPGHGGLDPGAVGHGLKEKDINLAVSLELEKMLLQRGVTVFLTRATDKDVTMKARTDYAAKVKADALISVHHNGAADPAARGIETFHSAYSDQSKRLGELVHAQLIAAFPETKNRGAKTKTFVYSEVDYYHMIRESWAAKIPAIITETGFMSNKEDTDMMKRPDFAAREAEALGRGICAYFGIPWSVNAETSVTLGAAIVINGIDDFSAAVPLAQRLQAPIFLRGVTQQLRARDIYVVGGGVAGLPMGEAEKVVDLSGETRFHTARNVGVFLGVFK